MKRVTGLGGVFFKSKDPEALKAWYEERLGIERDPWGGITFSWLEKESPENTGHTVVGVFENDTDYFDPADEPYMLNFRVENLHSLLDALRKEGVTVIDRVEEFDYGKFGWIVDPEGRKIELWEPPAGDPFGKSE